MRAIVIDAKKQEVREEEFDGEGVRSVLDYLHEKVADCVTVVHIEKGEDVWVDDEGLINGTQEFFEYPTYNQPLGGNGVILGTDRHGNSISTKLSVEEVRAKVKFLTIEDVLEGMRGGKWS